MTVQANFVLSQKQALRQQQAANAQLAGLATEYAGNPLLNGMTDAQTGSPSITAAMVAAAVALVQANGAVYSAKNAADLSAAETELATALTPIFATTPPGSIGAVVSMIARG